MTAALAPGYKPIHRLSNTEYNATVADVLGTSLAPANGSWPVYELNGFDNMAEAQLVPTDQYQRYFDAAGKLASDAFSRSDFKSRFVGCSTSDDACVRGTVAKLGLPILRRPLTEAEISVFSAVYATAKTQGESHESALGYVLQTMLSSLEFLYRIELDPNPGSSERHPLNAYELASRVSYLLSSSAPDDTLLAAAADGSLLKDEVLEATVARLLADEKRQARFVENFYGQWLGARRVQEHAVATDVYPAWSPDLAGALAGEMYAYFAEFLRSGRSWLEFLQADVNFVNAPLAQLYNFSPPSGTGLQRVEMTTDHRHGFLGLGGFLAQASLDRRTSPTLRGRWILINLLCTHPPSPPPNVPKIEAAAGMTDLSKGNVRAVLEKHRTNPACASCHALFDPYGIALERFSAIGSYRETYSDGSSIDPSTQLADGTELAGFDELTSYVSNDPRFKSCIADNLYGYGLGRLVVDADRDVVNGIVTSWTSGGTPSIQRLVELTVLDNTFRTRTGIQP